jgi:hypothetical protein
MKKDPKTITDPVEKPIAEALLQMGVNYIHEGEKGNDSNLDFYLPDHDVYIECKAFYSDRVINQIKDKRNVILVQGYDSANLLKKLLLNKF